MSTKEIESKARELRELKRLAEELAAEIDAAEDAIKAHMLSTGAEVLTAGEYRISWKQVNSSRVDTAALKRELPEIAAQFTRSITVRRFCVQ